MIKIKKLIKIIPNIILPLFLLFLAWTNSSINVILFFSVLVVLVVSNVKAIKLKIKIIIFLICSLIISTYILIPKKITACGVVGDLSSESGIRSACSSIKCVGIPYKLMVSPHCMGKSWRVDELSGEKIKDRTTFGNMNIKYCFEPSEKLMLYDYKLTGKGLASNFQTCMYHFSTTNSEYGYLDIQTLRYATIEEYLHDIANSEIPREIIEEFTHLGVGGVVLVNPDIGFYKLYYPYNGALIVFGTNKIKNPIDLIDLLKALIPDSTQKQYEENLLNCNDNLDTLDLRDKDLCYSISASISNDANFCEKIMHKTRQELCYMEIAKTNNSSDLCNKIVDTKMKDGCSVYVKKIEVTNNIDKNIILAQIDNKIGSILTDIFTQFAKEEIPTNEWQQYIDILLNKIEEKSLIQSDKQFKIENYNF